MTYTSTLRKTSSKRRMGYVAQSRLGDARAVESNPFLQSPTRRLHDRPLNLIFDAVGVDGLAAIVSSHCAAEANSAGFAVHFHIKSSRHIGGKVFVFCEGETASVM